MTQQLRVGGERILGKHHDDSFVVWTDPPPIVTSTAERRRQHSSKVAQQKERKDFFRWAETSSRTSASVWSTDFGSSALKAGAAAKATGL